MSVRRTLAAALAAGVLLSGCSDDPEPTFEPPASPSPSESESSSAQPEAQSPEEFIREWVKLQRDMQNTGDVDAYLRASKGCRSCSSTAQIVRDYYAAGGFVRTDGRSILDIDQIKAEETYDIKVRSAPTEYKESADAPLESFPGGVTTYRVTLRPHGQTWILTNEVEVSDS